VRFEKQFYKSTFSSSFFQKITVLVGTIVYKLRSIGLWVSTTTMIIFRSKP